MEEQKQAGGILASLFHSWDIGVAFGVAMFFGFIRYLQDVLAPDAPNKFKWAIAIAKGIMAGSVGILTYWLLTEWRVSEPLAAFLIGVAGYGGAETLQAFKEAVFNSLRNYLGKASDASERDAKS